MSSKRPRVDESPDENTLPSVANLLREQHQKLLDALIRLEADKEQVVADFEKQINDLKQQNQKLHLENESLRTTANTPPAVVPQEDNMANPTATMIKMALKFNLATDDRDLDEHEVEVLCRTLCNPQSLSILERFVENHDIRPSDLAYCIDGVVRQERFPIASYGENHTNCRTHMDSQDDCVCIIRQKNGWIIASGHRRGYEMQSIGTGDSEEYE